MGRLVTEAQNPTVLYVSGGNTQVHLLIRHSTIQQSTNKCINHSLPWFSQGQNIGFPLVVMSVWVLFNTGNCKRPDKVVLTPKALVAVTNFFQI